MSRNMISRAPDWLLKLILVIRYNYNWPELRELWAKDGGEQLCCSGRECGCYGATNRSEWEYYAAKREKS